LVINFKTAKALGLTHPANLAAAGGSGNRMMARRAFFVGGVAAQAVRRPASV
jgi:hypothetical protein